MTTHQKPLRVRNEAGSSVGDVIVTQQATLQAGGAATADFTMDLPVGARIVSVNYQTSVTHTSASAAVTAGSAAGGAQYSASTTVTNAGSAAATATTILAAWQSLAGNVTVNGRDVARVYFRLSLGAAQTSTGTTYAVVQYVA